MPTTFCFCDTHAPSAESNASANGRRLQTVVCPAVPSTSLDITTACVECACAFFISTKYSNPSPLDFFFPSSVHKCLCSPPSLCFRLADIDARWSVAVATSLRSCCKVLPFTLHVRGFSPHFTVVCCNFPITGWGRLLTSLTSMTAQSGGLTSTLRSHSLCLAVTTTRSR